MNKTAKMTVISLGFITHVTSFGMLEADRTPHQPSKIAQPKLLQCSLFKDEPVSIQNNLFENNNYKQLPPYILTTMQQILGPLADNTSYDRAIATYHATLRPRAIQLIVNQAQAMNDAYADYKDDETCRLAELYAEHELLKLEKMLDAFRRLDYPRVERKYLKLFLLDPSIL